MSLSMQDPMASGPGSMPTDSELIALARSGNESAFDQLCQRYYERIELFLARMIGNDEVGAELAQETFLKVWQALPGLREDGRFTSWLYRIAANLARDFQRRARLIRWLPWEEYETQGGTEAVRHAGPEQQVEEAELLKQALAHVSATYRACLILYVVEDLPQPLIAERLGIKPSSVSSYVARGLGRKGGMMFFDLSRKLADSRASRRLLAQGMMLLLAGVLLAGCGGSSAGAPASGRATATPTMLATPTLAALGPMQGWHTAYQLGNTNGLSLQGVAFVAAAAWKMVYTCAGPGDLTLGLTSAVISLSSERTGCSSPGPYETQEFPASKDAVQVQVTVDSGVIWEMLIEEQG